MFPTLRAAEHDALAPLLALARQKEGLERAAWLDDLRADAPTVVARLEVMLRDEADARVVPFERSPRLRDRGPAPLALRLSDAGPRSSVA